jgi:hypothetical protein
VFLVLRPAINRRDTTQRPLKGAKSRLQPALECSPARAEVGTQQVLKCPNVMHFGLGAKTLALLKSEQALTEVGKTAEVEKVAQQGQRITALTRTTALASLIARAKVTRYGLAGVGLYVLFTHPAAFTAGMGTLAEALGVPRWCGQLAIWMAIWMILLWFVSVVFIPIIRYLVFPPAPVGTSMAGYMQGAHC